MQPIVWRSTLWSNINESSTECTFNFALHATCLENRSWFNTRKIYLHKSLSIQINQRSVHRYSVSSSRILICLSLSSLAIQIIKTQHTGSSYRKQISYVLLPQEKVSQVFSNINILIDPRTRTIKHQPTTSDTPRWRSNSSRAYLCSSVRVDDGGTSAHVC